MRVDQVALSPDGEVCATLNDNEVLTVWDARRIQPRFTIPDKVRCFAAVWSSDELWTADGVLIARARQLVVAI